MVNSLAEGIAYARAHPLRDGGSWAGWCASFVYRFGGFSRSFTNAMAAGDWQEDRGRLRRDWNNAPAGAIHYWAGVGGDGHTAVDLGNNTLLMASGSVSNFGTALGTISFQSYANKGIPYRGWSMYWGDEALVGSGTAGSGSVPIPVVPVVSNVTENEMLHFLAVTTNALVASGQRFVQGVDGPLRVLGVGEWSVIEHNFPDVKPAEWSADQMVELIGRVGLREYETNGPSGIGRLTGRIVYSPAEGDRTYPRVIATNTVGGAAADLTPVLAAIAQVPAATRAAIVK